MALGWLFWADLVSSCSGLPEGCGCSQSGFGHSQIVLLVLEQTLQFKDGQVDVEISLREAVLGSAQSLCACLAWER